MPEPEAKSHPGVFAHALSLILALLTIALVASIGSYVFTTRPPLTLSEASAVVTKILQSHGPTSVSFRTGLVRARDGDNPQDIRYRLLEKAGIVTITQISSTESAVRLSRLGESMIKQIEGVTTTVQGNGVVSYEVPLAQMRLVDLSNIRKTGTGRATVQFTWKWLPNTLGFIFDPSGNYAQAFTNDEWTELIENYGARRYRQLPTKAAVALLRDSEGWKLAAD